MNSSSVPLTLETLTQQLRWSCHSVIHGDDSQGRWDVEFSSVFSAVDFQRSVRHLGWCADIRLGDTVSSFIDHVVLTVS